MLTILLVSFIGACVMPLLAYVVGRGAGLLISLLPFGLLAAFVSMASFVERGWVRGEAAEWAPWLGLDFTLRLDGFSFLFCLLITGIGALVTGVIIRQPLVGVLGFAIMFAGVLLAVAPPRKGATIRESDIPRAAKGRGTSPRFMDTLNDRWDKRQEGQG